MTRSGDVSGDWRGGGIGWINFGTITNPRPTTKIAPALFAVPECIYLIRQLLNAGAFFPTPCTFCYRISNPTKFYPIIYLFYFFFFKHYFQYNQSLFNYYSPYKLIRHNFFCTSFKKYWLFEYKVDEWVKCKGYYWKIIR